MAQIVYRGNLAAKGFPFIADFFGQSVVIPGPDQNFQRQTVSSEDPDKDIGRPQCYYCHNVMPSGGGFQSIGYTNPVMGFPAEVSFTKPIVLRDILGVAVYFVSTLDGRNFVLPFGNPSWRQINSIPGTAGTLLTTAYVSGQSYLYFATIGCYKYDSASDTLISVALAGLDVTKVLGITSAAGYLLAWTKNTVNWSSTIDPTDFIPSLITGAGGGGVESAKGDITACITHQLGFIVYTTENSVASVYSGNSRFPFNYKELLGSGGLANINLVSTGSDNGNSGNQYAYTTSGLQIIAMTGTQTTMPEVTDFISGKLFEDFNETTLMLVQTSLTTIMKKALTVISDRYLVISYGMSSLTHAIIYDTVMKRFGKAKIPHIACFEWKLLTPEVNETPRESIGFLQIDGSVRVVDFSYASTNSNGVMLLGKFEYVRSRTLILEQARFETVAEDASFIVTDQITIDGKTIVRTKTGYTKPILGKIRDFLFGTDGMNHTLVVQGKFYLNSFQLWFHIGGRR